jgi:hypothetical protein
MHKIVDSSSTNYFSIKVKEGDEESKKKLEEFKKLCLYVNTTSYSAVPSFQLLDDELKKHEKVSNNRYFIIKLILIQLG